MKIHTRKRAIFMRSVTRRNDSFGADTEGFALSSQRKAQITRRNAVSAQIPKRFALSALSAQRKLSYLLLVGLVILSNAECDMTPTGPGGDGTSNDPLAPTLTSTGPLSLARSTKVAHSVTLDNGDFFGDAVAFAGDLDGGGGTVLAVGATGDDNVKPNKGAIYLLSYNDAGVLQNTKKIADKLDETNAGDSPETTLAPTLAAGDNFGTSIANAGDLYGDGNTVLAVGADGDGTETFSNRGAIYLLSFSASGNLTSTSKIASGTAKSPTLETNDSFGNSLANAGDLDGGGGTVLAVGAEGTTGIGIRNAGAIYLLSFSTSGSLVTTKKIGHKVDETNGTATTENNNAPSIDNQNFFGSSIANVGDLYGNGNTVLAVGVAGATFSKGAIHLLAFDASGSLTTTKKIESGVDETTADSNANAPTLAINDRFGSSIANAGDLDGGGGTVLAVGADGDDTGGSSRCAIYLLSFKAAGSLTATPMKIASGTASGPVLSDSSFFGSSIANVGNLDGNGGRVLAVGGIGKLSSSTNNTGELQLLHYSK